MIKFSIHFLIPIQRVDVKYRHFVRYSNPTSETRGKSQFARVRVTELSRSDEDERGVGREARETIREVSEGQREKLLHTMIVTVSKKERERKP